MAILYSDAMSEGRKLALAAIDATEATQLASLQATRFFTQAFTWSPVFAARFITQATFLAFGLVEQRSALPKQPTRSANASPVTMPDSAAQAQEPETIGDIARAMATSADDAVQAAAAAADDAVQQAAAARKTIDDAAQALAMGHGDDAGAIAEAADDATQAFAATADDAAQAVDEALPARMMTADNAEPARIETSEEDQEIPLRAERLVINKQNVKHGEARVRNEIVTEMQTIQVPVSHEELVIEKFAVTGDADVDVDSAPIASETIRIPLTEEKVDISKKTVVGEVVEIGKLRVEGIEHISETVRHEELLVDDSTTSPATPWVNPDEYVKTPDDAASALITPSQALATIPDGVAPVLITPAQALATMPDGVVPALITPAQALAMSPDGVAPKLVTPAQAVAAMPDEAATEPETTTEDDQEIDLRAERLVINKQRAQTGKARARKEIVTETKSIAVPVSHEELVINRQTVTGDVDVDVQSAPITDETLRIPLSEEQLNVGKETVVREQVEIGKRRVEGLEHISDIVRHEELHVDDTTNHKYEPAF